MDPQIYFLQFVPVGYFGLTHLAAKSAAYDFSCALSNPIGGGLHREC